MAPKGPVIKNSKNVEIRPLRAFSGSPSENSTHKGHRDIGVADQIETTTEPGASRKALPERMNQQRPGNAKRWFAGACALCALPRIQVDWAFQKLVDRFLNHLFDGKPLLGSDDFQLLQGPLRNR
jgi:hypothetical protein